MDPSGAKGDVRLPDDHPRLSVVGPNGARADFLVVADEVRIGRAGASDVILPDATASYVHALLRRHGYEYEIVDLESRNGVFVNGARVDSPRVLENGDDVLIGRTHLTYSLPAEAAADDAGDESKDDVKDRRRIQAAWIAFASRIIANTLGAAAMIILGLLIAGGMPSSCGVERSGRPQSSEAPRDGAVSERRPSSTPERRPAPEPSVRSDPNG